MPVIKSAIKKLRQTKKKTVTNKAVKVSLKNVLDNFKKKPNLKEYSKLTSFIDKAAKNNIFHKNKASRLKSRLAKFLKK